MKLFIIFALSLLTLTCLHAQSYVDGGHTRHRFAQLTLGVTQRYLPKNGTKTYTKTINGFESVTINQSTETKINVGGLHFWGHADFYVSLDVLGLQSGQSIFRTDTETGLMYYPWRIEKLKLRPYIGVSMNPTYFQYERGIEKRRVLFPTQAGLTYQWRNQLIELGINHTSRNEMNYYYSREDNLTAKVSPIWFTASYKFILDTTLGAEEIWQTGKSAAYAAKLHEQKKLSGISLAIGPSSSWYLSESEHNKETNPHMDHPKSEGVYLDIGLGYYFYQPEIHINLAFRPLKTTLAGHDVIQLIERKSLTLETYKFLGDYHGFVPFIGPALSYEWLQVIENDSGVESASGSYNGIKPGITFGWDILPTKHEEWLLRTNLRWFPNLDVPMNTGYSFALDQIEFNFIQLVWYPERTFTGK